jgi:hypothetical protein
MLHLVTPSSCHLVRDEVALKNRRDILIIVGLFLALILFVALGPGRQPQPSDPAEATTHSSAPEGVLALYSWARELGYDSRRLEYRAFGLEERDAALIVLNPEEPISRTQSREILDWVEQGGTLIFADDRNAIFGASNALLDDLKFDTSVYTTTQLIQQAAPAQPALDQPPTGTALVRTGRVLIPHRDDYVALLGQPDALLVAGVKHGSGYIYLSATTYPFTNEGLRATENAALVLNMLRRVPGGGRIQFDEYHHGFFTPPSTGKILLGSPWGWAAAYAVAVIALYLILSGRRFGRPVPLKEEVLRRSSAEYVESMADLFQRGGKRDYILRHYHSAFKRDLARKDGVNPQLDDAEFARELARARGLHEQELLALLERLRAQKPSEAELVRAVSDADAMAAEILRSR